MNKVLGIVVLLATGCEGGTPVEVMPDMLPSIDLAPVHGADLLPGAPVQICTPGTQFCADATTVSKCNADGLGGDPIGTCGGSPTNPGVCSGTGGTHCDRQYATCKWSMSIPFLASGEVYNNTATNSVDNCIAGDGPSIAVDFTHAGTELVFSLPTTGLAAGQTYDISKSSITYAGCTSWSGFVELLSSQPYWDIVVQADCTAPSTNKSELSFEFSGAI